MEPVEISEPIDGWTARTYAKYQPQYVPLPTIQKDNDPEGRIITRWRPSAEDLTKLLSGDDLYLEVLTFGNVCRQCGLEQGLQPVRVGVWSDRVACVDGSVRDGQ